MLYSSFFMFLRKILIIYLVLYIFLICILIPIINEYPNINLYVDNDEVIWPIPGYTIITSNFGYRKAPTSGSSTYHSGIDIGAPEGAQFFAAFSGIITMAEFSRCWWI